MENLINKIHNCDNREILKQIPDKSIDLVLTDPPYGVRKEEWDNKDNFLKNLNFWLDECLRISNIVIWFCANKFIPYILQNRQDIFHRLLIWNKPKGSQFSGAMNNNLWYSIEPILVFSNKGGGKNSKDKKIGYSSFDYRTIAYNKYKHPTVKPLELIENLLYFYSNEGDLVFDGFSGSGTTAIACQKLKRNFICCEFDKNYYDTSIQRLNTELEKNKIF